MAKKSHKFKLTSPKAFILSAKLIKKNSFEREKNMLLGFITSR